MIFKYDTPCQVLCGILILQRVRVRPKNKKEVKKMARPRNKADLIVAATENFEKLVKMIEEMSDEEKAKEFDF